MTVGTRATITVRNDKLRCTRMTMQKLHNAKNVRTNCF